MSDPTVVSAHPAGGEGSDLTSCSTGASTPPKRAHAVVAEAATAQQKKHARPLPAADDEAVASSECAIEDEDAEPERTGKKHLIKLSDPHRGLEVLFLHLFGPRGAQTFPKV